MRRWPLVVAVIAVLLGGWYARGWYFSDERAIRNQLAGLALALSVQPGESGMDTLSRIARLRGYFAEDVRVLPGSELPPIESREALLALASGVASPPEESRVEFVDVQIDLTAGSASASINLTARFTTRDPRTGQQVVDAREADLTLEKREGGWVMTRVEARETLKRP